MNEDKLIKSSKRNKSKVANQLKNKNKKSGKKRNKFEKKSMNICNDSEIKGKETVLNLIKSYNNFDFPLYKKLAFFDERYDLEADFIKHEKENHFKECSKEEKKFHTPIAYEKMGVSLLIAILDYEELNPFSRIGNTDYKSVENLRLSIANNLINSEEKFRSSSSCNNFIKNLNYMKKFKSIKEEITEKILQKDKILKRVKSEERLKNVDPNYDKINNNIIINNFNNNFFNFTNNKNFITEEKNRLNKIINNIVNQTENQQFLTDKKNMIYKLKVPDALMNRVNINHFNYNICGFGNENDDKLSN